MRVLKDVKVKTWQVALYLYAARWAVPAGAASTVTNPVASVTPFRTLRYTGRPQTTYHETKLA